MDCWHWAQSNRRARAGLLANRSLFLLSLNGPSSDGYLTPLYGTTTTRGLSSALGRRSHKRNVCAAKHRSRVRHEVFKDENRHSIDCRLPGHRLHTVHRACELRVEVGLHQRSVQTASGMRQQYRPAAHSAVRSTADSAAVHKAHPPARCTARRHQPVLATLLM